MSNPVKNVIIPPRRRFRFSIQRSSGLGQGARIVVRTASQGTQLANFFLAANPTPDAPQEFGANPEMLYADVEGFYHYFSLGFMQSPDGKIKEITNNGDRIVVGFDDNGIHNNGDRDYDFDDCMIILELL